METKCPFTNALKPELEPLPYRMKGLPVELQLRIEVVGECWLWVGEIRKHDGRPIFLKEYAYRLTYVALRGPIPDGLVLHHRTCNQRLCVNPWHTRKANICVNTDSAAISAWGKR